MSPSGHVQYASNAPDASAAGMPSVPEGEIRRAMRAVVAVCPPESGMILNVLLDNLLTASRAGGILRSKLHGLDVGLRKHLRQTWLDGVVVPLARTRNPLHRAASSALPQLRDPRDVSGLLAAVRQIAGEVPEHTTAREHLDGAVRFLEALPILMRAVEALEARTFAQGAGRSRAVGYNSGARDDTRARQVRSAAHEFRKAARKALAPLVLRLADAVFEAELGAVRSAAFARAAPVLRSPPVGGPRKRGLAGPPWRRRLLDGLQGDIWGGFGAALETVLRRHPGLEVTEIAVDRSGDLCGRARAVLTRHGVRFAVATCFDLQVGSMRHRAEDLVGPGHRVDQPTWAEVDACLDAHVPPELDTASFRLMRHILQRDGGDGFVLDAYAEDQLVIACRAGGRLPEEFADWLVEAADALGVTLRFAADDGGPPVAELARVGFAWAEGKERFFMTRSAVPDPGTGPLP
jgi:hypothetical protein